MHFPPARLIVRERSDERANSRTVEIGDAGKVHGHVRRTGIDELLDLIAESLLGLAEFERSAEVKDRGPARFANTDVHVRLKIRCRS